MKPSALISQISPAEWKQAVRGLRSGGFSSKGRLIVEDSGVQVADTFYQAQELLLIGGSVSFDRLAQSRGSSSMTLEALTDYGLELTNPLMNYDFLPQIGIETEDYVVWIPQGKYSVVDQRKSSGTGRRTVQISLVDLSSRFRERPWKEPFAFTGTPSYDAAIQQILDDRAIVGAGFFVGTVGSGTIPAAVGYSGGEDPWASMWTLAQSNGGELFFDRYGTLRAKVITSFSDTAPSVEILGDQYNILDGAMAASVSRNEIYNGVICRGEAPWLLFPVSGEKWDEDPLSLTYRYGPFGERPKIIGDSVVGTDAQCLTVAEAEYERIAGVQKFLNMRVLVDPSLDVGSVVRVMGEESGLYLVDRIQLGLLDMKMSITARKRLAE